MRRRDFIAVLGGAVFAWPLAARPQQAMPTVGVVVAGTRKTSTFPEPFLRSMKELGWDEDRNYRVLFLGTEGYNDRYPGLVGELVAQRVNVIIVFGNPGIEAARRATTTIPIVGVADDIVKSGFAVSMAHPGGNTTGVSILARELDVKRLELLHEAVPAAKRIGVLADPRVTNRSQLDEAAHQLNLELVMVDARTREEVAAGLDALEAARLDAVNVLSSPAFFNVRGLVIERLNRARLPAIYEWPEMADEGGLLGYGARLRRVWPKVARLVAKILRRARPEDLPVEQPEKIDLVVNLRTARALGLTIPPSILIRADEAIE